MPGKCGLGAAWHATHNDVQNLVLLAIIMLISLAVLAVDGVHRLFQLRHMLWRARIQRVLHHRLFGTSAPSEGCLQCPSALRRLLISTSPCAPVSIAIHPSYSLSMGASLTVF